MPGTEKLYNRKGRGAHIQKEGVKWGRLPNVPLSVPVRERDAPLNVLLTEIDVPLSEREKTFLIA